MLMRPKKKKKDLIELKNICRVKIYNISNAKDRWINGSVKSILTGEMVNVISLID